MAALPAVPVRLQAGFADHVPPPAALTARDANSDALVDHFDFSCGRDLSTPPPPAAGVGGCP